jgi:hypothetical protein
MGVGGGGDLGVPGLLPHFPPKVGARQNDFGTKDAGHCGEKFWRDHSHLAGQDLLEECFFLLLATVKRKYARKLVCFVFC